MNPPFKHRRRSTSYASLSQAVMGSASSSSNVNDDNLQRRRRNRLSVSDNNLNSSMRRRASASHLSSSTINTEEVLSHHQRQQILESIDRLSYHLPQTVLDQLVRQVVNEENEEQVLGLLGKSINLSETDRYVSKTKGKTKPKRSKSLNELLSVAADNPQDAEKVPAKIILDTNSMQSDESWFLQDILAQEETREDTMDSGGTIGTSNVGTATSTRRSSDLMDQDVTRLCQGRQSSSAGNLSGLDMSFHSLSSQNTTTAAAEGPSVAHMHANKERLESTRHKSAILFVDISGFTKLSRSLEVESLSKVINSYFQKIVEIIRAYGGDVLKFAGDALLVEWKLRGPNSNKSKKENPYHHPAFQAAVCAAKLVDACSDFAVKCHTPSPTTTLLNIHCALGFGDVVGTHVGNRNRMEYVILGDALRQIKVAMQQTNLGGEVIASPEVLQALEGFVLFSSYLVMAQNGEEPSGVPQLIAYKSQLLFRPVDAKASASTTFEKTNVKLSTRCQGWTMSMLARLQNRMSPYAHPAILQTLRLVPSFQSIASSSQQCQQKSRRRTMPTMPNRTASAFTTEQAELRDVVTVFLQPILPDDVDVMDPHHVSKNTLDLLQQIMMIVQTETDHYQGQLRQFIVDDKGLVLIVNWGLRGSTYPNMVEERIMPCLRKIQTLLRTELGIDSNMGATSGKAYCGVVGAYARHEYAVLAPSVNLAARLMGNEDNPGFLLDRTLVHKAGSNHPFRARTPITAKGYDNPVRIYEPVRNLKSFEKTWLDIEKDQFVGRSAQVNELKALAIGIEKSNFKLKGKRKSSTSAAPSSKLVFISGSYGVGKSTLLSEGTRQIEAMASKGASCRHVTRHIFNEDDSFKPFSIVRPLFLDILRRRRDNKNKTYTSSSEATQKNVQADVRKQEEAHLHLIFLQTCLQAGIPMQYIEMFAGMIFTESLSDGDIGQWSDKQQKMSEWIRTAQWLVRVYLEMTSSFDLVVLALDDISCMDEMSWRVVKRLYERASKFLILGAARSEHGLNLQAGVWEEMKGTSMPTTNSSGGRKFIDMKLGPMAETEIESLTQKRLSKGTVDNKAISRTIYFLSEGNTLLAGEIAEIFAESNKLNDPTPAEKNSNLTEGVRELLLNRLDALPSSVRLHVQCGAILGHSFSLSDVVAVMEKYKEVSTAEEKAKHELEVRHSLHEAQQTGFLSMSQLGDTQIVVFTFSHKLLREVISEHILEEFKDKISRMIDSINKSGDHLAYHEFWRNVSGRRSKALPVRSV